MNLDEIKKCLQYSSDPAVLQSHKRFAIHAHNAYGVRVPVLRKLAKTIGINQELSLKIWESRIFECRLLASMIGDPCLVSLRQMDTWTQEFSCWATCDACCGNLFVWTNHAYSKAIEWTYRSPEFEKRAGFALIAELAVHNKDMEDSVFEVFWDRIIGESCDERNFVKKAVNWALRQLGKRNSCLNAKAIYCAQAILEMDSKSAKWIARDALRELRSEAVLSRLNQKEAKKIHIDRII